MTRHRSEQLAACLCWVAVVIMPVTAQAAPRRRGPSPQQVQKMKEELAYRQREYLRVQAEVAAKQQELIKQFDENGDGRLLGPERSKFDKHLQAIRDGRAPNPLADIKPLGQGPRSPNQGRAGSPAPIGSNQR